MARQGNIDFKINLREDERTRTYIRKIISLVSEFRKADIKVKSFGLLNNPIYANAFPNEEKVLDRAILEFDHQYGNDNLPSIIDYINASGGELSDQEEAVYVDESTGKENKILRLLLNTSKMKL